MFMVPHLVLYLSKILLENIRALGKHVVNVLVIKLQKTREHYYWTPSLYLHFPSENNHFGNSF